MLTAIFFGMGEFINKLPPEFAVDLSSRLQQVLTDQNIDDPNDMLEAVGDAMYTYLIGAEDLIKLSTGLAEDGLTLVSASEDGRIIVADESGATFLLGEDGSLTPYTAPAVTEPVPNPLAAAAAR